MANKFPYSTEYDGINKPFGWKVVRPQRTIARCISREDAELVKNALNFNYSPGAYGYKLVD